MGKFAVVSLTVRVVLGVLLAIVWLALGKPRFGQAGRPR